LIQCACLILQRNYLQILNALVIHDLHRHFAIVVGLEGERDGAGFSFSAFLAGKAVSVNPSRVVCCSSILLPEITLPTRACYLHFAIKKLFLFRTFQV
jgi:hypothetical protein